MDFTIEPDYITALCAVFMAVYALSGRFTANIHAKLNNMSDEIIDLKREFFKVQREISYLRGRQDQSDLVSSQTTEVIRDQT